MATTRPSAPTQMPSKNAWQRFLDATVYNPRVNPMNGITKGMATTFQMSVDAWFDGKATLEYPEMKKEIADRWRGAHELLLEPGGGLICISCNLCAEACPVDCIEVTFQMDGKTRMLDQYAVDLSKCLFCDLCVEACPTFCLIMTKKYEYSDYSRWEDSTLYISREKGIERQATREEFRDMVLRGYSPKYTEVTDYFAPAEIDELGIKIKPRKKETPEERAHYAALKAKSAAAPAAGAKAAAPAGVSMDYGTLGREKYELWAKDTRKASELTPDERKEKAAYIALQKKNQAAGATPDDGAAPATSGQAPGPGAPAAVAIVEDYGDLGKEKYYFWAGDGRKASELSPDERKEKAAFVALKRKNDAAQAAAGAEGAGASITGAAPMAQAAPAPAAAALDYGTLGREKYEFWAADTRKASELSGEERKEKATYTALARKNAAALEAGASTAPAAAPAAAAPAPAEAAPAPAASDNDDYGTLGREKYEFWMADTRRASELSGEEHKEKAEAMAIKRRRGE